jgi:hypothetical protein
MICMKKASNTNSDFFLSQVEKKKIRVSFGENQVRSLSPGDTPRFTAKLSGSAHSRLGLPLAARAAGGVVGAPEMTSKIAKIALGGGKFETRKVLVPVRAAAATTATGVVMAPIATSSAGILAAETRMAAAATSPSGGETTVRATVKRSLSSSMEVPSG